MTAVAVAGGATTVGERCRCNLWCLAFIEADDQTVITPAGVALADHVNPALGDTLPLDFTETNR